MKKRIVIAGYSGDKLSFVVGAYACVDRIDDVTLPPTLVSRAPDESFDRVYRFWESSDNGTSRVATYKEMM